MAEAYLAVEWRTDPILCYGRRGLAMNILRLRIKSADEWRELAPSDNVAEPIFVPTTDELKSGEQVIVEISSNLLPNKVLIRGAVQAWRPALPRMRVRAGATVQLDVDERTCRGADITGCRCSSRVAIASRARARSSIRRSPRSA
jgi:hypothetical protein